MRSEHVLANSRVDARSQKRGRVRHEPVEHDSQPETRRLEQRADMLLSTLQSYVEAIGGRLAIVAELPNRPPVRIKQLSMLADPPDSYRTMAADKEREREASEWVENLTGDIADEPR